VWIDAFGASLDPVWAWMSLNEKAAAWIQAFGSIAAILGSTGVAIYLFSREVRIRTEEAEARAIAESLAALRTLATGVMMLKASLQLCERKTAAETWTKESARLAQKNIEGAYKLLVDVDGHLLPPWFELQRGVLMTHAINAEAMMIEVDDIEVWQPGADFEGFTLSLVHIDAVIAATDATLYKG
jgi:hypothetical protein